MNALAKRLFAVVLTLGMVLPSHAEWRGDREEWGIPRDITTEDALNRHKKVQKRFFIAGVASLLAGVALYAQSSKMSKKADRIDPTPGPSVFNSSGMGVEVWNHELGARQASYRRQSTTYKKLSMASAMLSTICFTVALSLRF